MPRPLAALRLRRALPLVLALPLAGGVALRGKDGSFEELLSALPLAGSVALRGKAAGFAPFGMNDEAGNTSTTGRKRIAIVTSGSVLRYNLNGTTTNLIAPLVDEGHTVDYYVTLNMEGFRSWTPNANSFVQDPKLRGSPEELRQKAVEQVRQVGGTLRNLTINEHMDLNDQEKFFMLASKWNALFNKPQQMKDADYAKSKAAWEPKMYAARNNLLKLLRALQDLWPQVEEVERLQGRYDLVIFQKDDSYWLRPFHLGRLLQEYENVTSNPRFGFSLYCDFLTSYHGTGPNELTEYVFVLSRDAADTFGNQHGHLFGPSAPKYWSVNNLEAFSYMLAKDAGIVMQAVPAHLMPMERVGYLNRTGTAELCLHKWCDCKGEKALKPKEEIPMCEDPWAEIMAGLQRGVLLR